MAVVVGPEDAGRSCPYCRFALKSGISAERCVSCKSLHHTDCWRDGGGCAVFGCPMAGATNAAASEIPLKEATAAATPTLAATSALTLEGATAKRSGVAKTALIGASVGAVVVALAVAAFVLFTGTDHSRSAKSTVQQSAAATTSPGSQPPGSSTSPDDGAPPTPTSETRVAKRIAAAIELSLAGRSAVRAGQYDEAVTNRRRVLVRLNSIRGASGRAAAALRTLRRAMHASLTSDLAYASGADASDSDAEATRLKRIFVNQFRPIADDDGLPGYSAEDF